MAKVLLAVAATAAAGIAAFIITQGPGKKANLDDKDGSTEKMASREWETGPVSGDQSAEANEGGGRDAKGAEGNTIGFEELVADGRASTKEEWGTSAFENESEQTVAVVANGVETCGVVAERDTAASPMKQPEAAPIVVVSNTNVAPAENGSVRPLKAGEQAATRKGGEMQPQVEGASQPVEIEKAASAQSAALEGSRKAEEDVLKSVVSGEAKASPADGDLNKPEGATKEAGETQSARVEAPEVEKPVTPKSAVLEGSRKAEDSALKAVAPGEAKASPAIGKEGEKKAVEITPPVAAQDAGFSPGGAAGLSASPPVSRRHFEEMTLTPPDSPPTKVNLAKNKSGVKPLGMAALVEKKVPGFARTPSMEAAEKAGGSSAATSVGEKPVSTPAQSSDEKPAEAPKPANPPATVSETKPAASPVANSSAPGVASKAVGIGKPSEGVGKKEPEPAKETPAVSPAKQAVKSAAVPVEGVVANGPAAEKKSSPALVASAPIGVAAVKKEPEPAKETSATSPAKQDGKSAAVPAGGVATSGPAAEKKSSPALVASAPNSVAIDNKEPEPEPVKKTPATEPTKHAAKPIPVEGGVADGPVAEKKSSPALVASPPNNVAAVKKEPEGAKGTPATEPAKQAVKSAPVPVGGVVANGPAEKEKSSPALVASPPNSVTADKKEPEPAKGTPTTEPVKQAAKSAPVPVEGGVANGPAGEKKPSPALVASPPKTAEAPKAEAAKTPKTAEAPKAEAAKTPAVSGPPQTSEPAGGAAPAKPTFAALGKSPPKTAPSAPPPSAALAKSPPKQPQTAAKSGIPPPPVTTERKTSGSYADMAKPASAKSAQSSGVSSPPDGSRFGFVAKLPKLATSPSASRNGSVASSPTPVDAEARQVGFELPNAKPPSRPLSPAAPAFVPAAKNGASAVVNGGVSGKPEGGAKAGSEDDAKTEKDVGANPVEGKLKDQAAPVSNGDAAPVAKPPPPALTLPISIPGSAEEPAPEDDSQSNATTPATTPATSPNQRSYVEGVVWNADKKAKNKAKRDKKKAKKTGSNATSPREEAEAMSGPKFE